MTVLGYRGTRENDRRVKTDTTKDYTVQLVNEFEAAESVARPFAYLVPPTFREAVATLQRHGLDVAGAARGHRARRGGLSGRAIEQVAAAVRGPSAVDAATSRPRKESRLVPAGTLVVRTAQPLGNLAVMLLEPRSEDGLATWNFFDDELKEGATSPCRGYSAGPISSRRAPSRCRRTAARCGRSRSSRGRRRRRRRPGRASAGGQLRWLDGEHWLQSATAGSSRSTPGPAARSRSSTPRPGQRPGPAPVARRRKRLSRSPARRPSTWTRPNEGFLFEHGQDLYYATFDGSHGGPADQAARPRAVAAVQPRRQARRLRPRLRPVRRRHRHSDRAPPDHRRPRRPAPRPCRLGLLSRRSSTAAGRRSGGAPTRSRLAFMEFDDAGVPYHTVLDDAASPRTDERRITPAPASRTRRSGFGVVARDGGGAVGRSLRLFARFVADQRGRLVARRLGGLLLRPGPRPDLARPGQGHARRCEGPVKRAVPRHDQGVDREPRADPLARRQHVPLAQRARRLEAYLPVRRRWHAQGRSHVGPVGGPPDRARRSQDRLDLLHRHARQPDGDGPLPRQAAAVSRAAHAVAGQPHRRREPGRQALPLELVRHPDAGPAPTLSRRTASWSARSTPTRRTRRSGSSSARTSGSRSRPRTASCSRPS